MFFSFRRLNSYKESFTEKVDADHIICFDENIVAENSILFESGRCVFDIIRSLLKMKQTVLLIEKFNATKDQFDKKKRVDINSNLIFLNINAIYFFKNKPSYKLDSFDQVKRHIENF